jgi:hypothetical protein
MSNEKNNVLILHCACGATKRFKANTNSGILLQTEASDWGCAENDVKAGGHCRGLCPSCRQERVAHYARLNHTL